MSLISCLLWKNWQINKKHSKFLVAIYAAPFFAVFTAVLLREIYQAVTTDSERSFSPFDPTLMPDELIKKLGDERLVLHYTPDSRIFSLLIERAKNYLHLKRIKGHETVKDLEEALLKTKDFAGVQFPSQYTDMAQLPEKLPISLRLPGRLRADSGQIWRTGNFLPEDMNVGARNPDTINDGIPSGYYAEGFLALQSAVSFAFLKEIQPPNWDKALDINPYENKPTVLMQRYPYAEVVHDDLYEVVGAWLPTLISAAYLPVSLYIVWNVAREKGLKIKRYMRLLGYNNLSHWYAWFLNAFLMFFIISSIVTILLLIPFYYSRGAVIDEISGLTIYLILLVYSIQQIWFCFTFGVVFSSSIRTLLLYAVVHFILVHPAKKFVTLFDATLMAQLPNMALKLMFQIITTSEIIHEELEFLKIFEPGIVNPVSLVTIMLCMLVSTVFYIFACQYLEVLVGCDNKKSLDKDFFITEKVWEISNRHLVHAKLEPQMPRRTVHLPSISFVPSIQLNNINVKIKNYYLLKDFYLNAYPGEVTVLWGARNSGKTTVLKVLTGRMIPSRGKALILDRDIVCERKEALRNIGLCLEDNYFFQTLTSAEHIRFYSCLRGLKTAEKIDQEVRKYLDVMGLLENDKIKVSLLSYAHRRILAICCAYCGHTKAVLLDEPTAGLHTADKYIIWDLIKKEKFNRTTLVFTANMQEAEALADRIGIIHYGRLKSYGTPFFLKSLYVPGYQLIVVKALSWGTDNVTPLLEKLFPAIRLEADDENEIKYRIPDKHKREIEQILKEIENRQSELHIQSFRLHLSKMEDIILEEKGVTTREIIEPMQIEAPHKYKQMKGHIHIWFDTGYMLFKNQCHAILLKMFLYSWHHGRLSVLQFFLPLWLIVGYSYLENDSVSNLKPLSVNGQNYLEVRSIIAMPEAYAKTQTPFDSAVITNYSKYIDGKSNYHLQIMYTDNFHKDMINLRTEYTQGFIDTRYLAGVKIDTNKFTALLNNQPLHTPPFTLDLLINAMIRGSLGSIYSVEIKNAPLPFPPSDVLVNASTETTGNRTCCFIYVIGYLLALISSCYVCFPIKERMEGWKELQCLAGVNVCVFWLLHLIWDMITFSFTAITITAVTYCLGIDGLYGFPQTIHLYLILLAFGPSMLTFAYVVSFFFKTATLGFSCFFVFQVMYVTIIPSIEQFSMLSILARVLPIINLEYALNDYNIYQRLNEACGASYLRKLSNEELCKMEPDCCDIPSPFGFSQPTVLNDIIVMFCLSIFYFLILLLLYYFVHENITNTLKKRWLEKPETIKQVADSPDVKAEKLNIKTIPYPDFLNCSVLLDNVSKFYYKENFLAINEIAFRVRARECFVLLGPMGSGKTTVINCISGFCAPTDGAVYVKTLKVMPYSRKISNEIGYCPQSDLFFLDYTGRENLIIIGLLRGIRWPHVQMWASKIAKLVGFYDKLGLKANRYSIADKRRLSLAIAATGQQSILLLDEPTDGLDPDSQREIWRVIENMIDAGYCVILSTKNIEACDKLATKMAVIVNGHLKYIGTYKHLSRTACDTLKLKFKFAFNVNYDDKYFNVKLKRRSTEVKYFIKKHLEDCKITEDYGNVIEAHMKVDSMKLSEVFEVINSHLGKVGIQEFTVSVESFEDKFHGLSNIQRERFEVDSTIAF